MRTTVHCVLVGLLTLGACSNDADTTASEDSSSSTSMTATMSTSDTPTSTSTGAGSSQGTTMDAPTDGSSGASSTATTVGSSGGPTGDPDGTPCTDGSMCESGFCFGSPDELVCTVCERDEDCPDAGCIPLAEGGAVCSKKNPQSPCTQDEACFSGMCPLALDTGPYAGELRGCSMCTQDSDCGNGAICGIRINLSVPTASLDCVAIGSLPNDFWCPIGASGDMACTSGLCEPVGFEGFDVGVCGDCETDNDCTVGTCTVGSIHPELLTATGSTCG